MAENSMLRSLESLRGDTIRASDGDIGEVDDFYFDNELWKIRYLVVKTGGWLTGRRVLLSPDAIGRPIWEEDVLPVDLTREQVENSPDIDLARPVSRQEETMLLNYYGWPLYWATPTAMPSGPWPTGAIPPVVPAPETDEPEPSDEQVTEDEHLHSVDEVTGYHIQAQDGEIGHVEDFLADDKRWFIHYMVVDTGNWLPGRKVLIAPPWIGEIVWAEAEVHVALPREAIKNSPEYDPAKGPTRAYEKRLYDHYRMPPYWEEYMM